MERLPRGRYMKEFREEAVKLVTEEKLPLPEAERRLNIAPSTTLKETVNLNISTKAAEKCYKL